ncbi:MAG TPA: hypothetical protein VIO13_10830 [Candidatus Dormibacteraeota bacterium]
MPVREIAGKTIGFGLVALALITGGILDLLGGHVYNDYLNAALGIILILMGLAAGGLGTFLIVGILYEERLRRREEQVHVTPRGSPPAPPPPWGMADVGKPPGVMRVGDAATAHGGGSPRVMSVTVSNLDAPMLIVGLLAWTILTLVLFAPH